MIIFGDVAGQYNALEKLLKQIPKNPSTRLIFVGDLMDRGPKPIEVVDFVKKNAECIYGNHEDMFVDYYRNQNRYETNLWTDINGGDITHMAYQIAGKEKLEEHLAWIEKLPWYIETDEYFISHGIWRHGYTLEQACRPFNQGHNSSNLIWNRDYIMKRDKFQIYGHNGFNDIGEFSVCIDGQRQGLLTAYDTDTKKVYKQRF